MSDPFLDLAEQNVQWLKDEPRTHHELLEDAREAVDDDPVRQELHTLPWENSRRLWKMMMLAPTVEVLDALVRGEAVPIERLDPVWVKRFGLRDQEAA